MKKLLIITGAIVLVGVVVGAYFLVYQPKSSATDALKVDPYKQLQFTFDGAKAPGWQAGVNAYPLSDPDTAKITSDEPIPGVTMKTTYDTGAAGLQGCFVRYMYWSGALPGDILAQREADRTKGTAMQLTPFATSEMTMGTKDGQKTYTLHHYSLDGSYGNEELMRGVAFGFFEVSGGYVEVRAYCDTAQNLVRIHDVVRAVSLQSSPSLVQ